MPCNLDQPTWSAAALTSVGLKSSRDAELWLRSMGRDPADVGDEDLPQAIAEVKDEQELLSRKYSSSCLLVLPLSSGSIAILSLDRQDYRIVQPSEFEFLAGAIDDCEKAFGSKMKQRAMHVERLRASGLDEPGDRALARDIKRANAPPPSPQAPARRPASVELDLADL